MILFHSGNLGESTSFWPLTHFGTREAALDRALKRCETNRANGLPAPVLYLYECDVELADPTRIFAVDEDWGSPWGIALIGKLYETGKFGNPEKRMDDTMHILAARAEKDRAQERMLASQFLQRLKWDAVTYRNIVEAKGSTSYCIVDPTLIKIQKRHELFYSSENVSVNA